MPTPTRTLRRATITGLGMYVPERILTNRELETLVETSDQWIVDRTGIRERRIASEDQATSDLAIPAAQEALRVANLSATDLDLIIVATCTGDMGSFPATAAIVQDRLEAKQAAAFDVVAVCSGFVYALDVAAQYIETGRYSNVLVIGAEIMSRLLDWTDRNTCVLFGDGAGAVVVQAAEEAADEGILGSILGTDGSGVWLLNVPSGGTRSPLTPDRIADRQQYMTMRGKEVYRFAVEIMGEAAVQALGAVGLQPSDVDLFIPHQANTRIITAAAKRLDLPMEKVFVNVDRYGNTSAASVPLAMVEAWKMGKIQPGNLLVTVGFGAGLTWGANVIRWGNVTP
ncbi:MAG: ketoacyl-ACP synthase III [Cytophagales bacterium]|nr:ketoacyl-ACP synthase III [Armatimonadota bacterium]